MTPRAKRSVPFDALLVRWDMARMTRSARSLVVVLALFAPLALGRCDCVDPLSGLPVAQIELVDDAGNSHLQADPWLVIDFGDADSGQTNERTLTIKNIGTGLMSLDGACLVTAADVEAAKTAACIVGQTTAFTFVSPAGETIRKGESLDVALAFSPVAGGPASLFMKIESNAGDEPVVAVELVGRGTDGRLCAEPAGIFDFGDVDVGVTAPGQITVRNCGVKPVTIDELAFAQNPDSAFTFTAQGGAGVGTSLAENETMVLDVTFTPQQAGPYRDTRAGDIRIVTAAPFAAQYDLLLLGDGVVPPACKVNVVPGVLNFNAVASGTTATRDLIIQSVGQCGCTIDAISEPAPASAGFALVAGSVPSLPFTLRGTLGCDGDPAGTADAPTNLTIQVSYTSPERTVPVVDNAALDVTTSDAIEPVQTVQLEANGGGSPFCQLDVTPVQGPPSGFNFPAQGRYGVVEFGRTSVHVPKRLPITLTNVGNTTCTVSSLDWDKRENTLANEFSLETDAGAPAIPSAAFGLEPGETRTFFAVFSPTHTVESGGLFNFGSYSASITTSTDPLTLGIFCGGALNGPNASCNGVRFVTNDTVTDITSGHDAGVFSIGFAGTPVEPQVDVIPGELDFGLVTLDCGSPLQRVTVYNNGGADLIVNEPVIDPVSNPVLFRVEGTTNPTGTWPFAIPPGGSMSIEVRYFARQLGLQTSNLAIPTVEGGQAGPPVLIPLRGEGTTDTSQHDVFDQFSDPKVDVLWVVDDSGSMAPFQQQLADNFNQFFVASNIINADYHIAVTTTLTADGNCIGAPPTCQQDSDCGQGGQCALGLCTAGEQVNSCDDDPMSGWYTSCVESEHYLSPVTADPEARFECNVKVSEPNNVNPDRPGSDNAEGGFRAAYKFLSPRNIDDPAINGGFLRDDAKLHVIMVSDEPEQSKGSVDQYIDFFKNVKGFRNEGLVAVSAIAAPPQGCTYNSPDGAVELQDDRYQALVNEMNGRFQEICNSDWTGMMSQLGLDSLGLRVEFFLTRAAEEASIQVCVRATGAASPCTPMAAGTEGGATGWFYDSATNSVVFNSGSVPPRGSRVEVQYGTFCFGP